MRRSRLSIARVQARAVKRAKANGLSPDDIERVKRSGEAAFGFARQGLKTRARQKLR